MRRTRKTAWKKPYHGFEEDEEDEVEEQEDAGEDDHGVLVEAAAERLVEQRRQVRDDGVPDADHGQARHRQQDVHVLQSGTDTARDAKDVESVQYERQEILGCLRRTWQAGDIRHARHVGDVPDRWGRRCMAFW